MGEIEEGEIEEGEIEEGELLPDQEEEKSPMDHFDEKLQALFGRCHGDYGGRLGENGSFFLDDPTSPSTHNPEQPVRPQRGVNSHVSPCVLKQARISSRTLNQEQEIEDGEFLPQQEEEIEDGEFLPQQEEEKMPIDPDSLTYIDEKVEKLFGHLRKKFDQELSAGNLGAMFGGYGSFLHDAWSSPSVLVEPSSQQGRGKTLLIRGSDKGFVDSREKGQHDSMLPVENWERGLATVIKLDQIRRTEEKDIEDGQFVPFQKDPIDEQRDEKWQQHSKCEDAPFESPRTILQIMTSFPVPGDHLLSPLSENILQLTRRTREGGYNDCRSSKKSTAVPLMAVKQFDVQNCPRHDTSNGPDASSMMRSLEEARHLTNVADRLKDEHRDEKMKHHSKYQNAPVESPGTILQIMTSFQIPGGHLLSPLPDSILQLKKRKIEGGYNDFRSSKKSTTDALKVMRQFDVENCPRQDTSNGPDASNAMRIFEEARHLKHIADRLKNHGPELERTDLYFEAAVKFLQAASLLEPPSLGKSEYGHGIQSLQIYSDTTRLFEYCAHEYERSKLMAAAALAHKCVEVTHMKIAYFKHSNASKDQHELKKSPRKRAKITLIRPNFMRLLNYINDLNSAFEATMKCRNAVEAAAAELNDRDDRLSSVKEVIKFNYHNVEGFLRVLRPSMASIRQ